MLRNSGPAAKPDIQKAVDRLLSEDVSFDRYDNRSAHRKHLVRAVEIELRESGEIIHAFSRNISGNGIGVITHEQLQTDTIAVLRIAALTGEDTHVLAECRWCKPCGEKWFISGWQFISLKR
jgi:hypothetical protein